MRGATARLDALNAFKRLPRPLRKTLDLADSERRHASAQWRALSAATFLVLGCATSATTAVTPAVPAIGGAADRSFHLLEGRFDSADQARSTPGYPPIQLVACPADVPSLGPRALYVEQARMDATDAPERQRVYVFEQGDPAESTAVARVFELAEPRSSVGACGRSVPPRFSRDELVERVGCTVSLRADGPVYRGATSGRSCPTTLKGATYVTSDVVLDTVGLRSWERGYDPSGAQKWGAESGPYVFVRRTPLPSP